MEKFKFIDITTADVAFEAFGKDLNELFANAALAMFEVMVNTEKVEAKEVREIEVEGIDLESLLFNWLNELLFYYGSENLVFKRFEVEIDEKNFKLKAKAYGEKFNREKHEAKTEVKSCTYHKLKIERNEFWKVRVILDV